MVINIFSALLGETLEAGIIIAVLLAIAVRRYIDVRVIVAAVLCGCVFAGLYAQNLASVSELWDYTGQELVNAFLRGAVCLLLLGVSVLLNFTGKRTTLIAMIAMASAFAIVQELAETIVLIDGFRADMRLTQLLFSAFIGTSIGVCLGVLVYYLLLLQPHSTNKLLQALMAFLSAGMGLQSVQFLIQADYLDAGAALWDSSQWLDEASIAGRLLNAVFGYESNPNVLEAMTYGMVLALFALLYWRSSRAV